MNDIYKKFPPERKEEFLNWVMLTQPNDSWSKVVYNYIFVFRLSNWKEGFDFVVKWSNDPPFAAYLMANNCHVNPDWAIDVIKKDKSGSHASYAAYQIALAKRDELSKK